jgi:Cdc6-like AAA superfamily ATPase
MESDVAGWNFGIGEILKRRPKDKAGRPPLSDGRFPKWEARGAPAEDDTTPRFHSTASDQPSNRRPEPLGVTRSRLRHAFAPSQPVAERRMFAGRLDVLRTVIRSIEDQRLHVVIYGERGIGKTSTLHMLTQAASAARYLVIYTSCGAHSSFDETFRAASQGIPLLYHSDFGPTSTRAERGDTIADLLTAAPLTPRQFGDIASKLTGTRILIILDEFDRCDSLAFRRDVAEIIKNLSDRQGRVQLVLAGVATDLHELVEHIPSIRRNIYAIRVPKMTDAEVREIISNGEKAAGITFDAGASTSIISMVLGSPYIANLLCHHAGHAAIDAGRNLVLPEDVSEAITRTLEEFQSRIPKTMLSQIGKLFDQGLGASIAMVARVALAADLVVTPSDLAAADDAEAHKAQQAVTALCACGALRSLAEEGPEQRYAFEEEGLPAYLWIRWAHRQAAPKADKPRVAARS